MPLPLFLSLAGYSGLSQSNRNRLLQGALAAFFCGRFFKSFSLGKFADVAAYVFLAFASRHNYTAFPVMSQYSTHTNVMAKTIILTGTLTRSLNTRSHSGITMRDTRRISTIKSMTRLRLAPGCALDAAESLTIDNGGETVNLELDLRCLGGLANDAHSLPLAP
jgi:hypothetical protein